MLKNMHSLLCPIGLTSENFNKLSLWTVGVSYPGVLTRNFYCSSTFYMCGNVLSKTTSDNTCDMLSETTHNVQHRATWNREFQQLHIIIIFATYVVLKKKPCSPVKNQEVLVLKKLLASVYQVFIFGPRGFFSSSIVSMTAGRDSGSLTTAFSKHCALVKCPLHLIPFYSLAVSVKIRQSREELTRQPNPEQHYRVVI